jgi:hypothetical protein
LDSHPLDERPRPKKWQIEAKPTWHHFGGKFNWFRPKTKTKRKGAQMKACDSEREPRCKSSRVPRPKSGKSRQNLHKTILKGNSIGSDPKK